MSAGEGVRAALENLCPAGHTKELSASKSCTRGIFLGQEKCHRVKCNLGDQILLTLGRHALPALQLVPGGLLQLRAWTSFTIPQSAHVLRAEQ